MPHPATIHMGNTVASTIEGEHAAGTSYNRVFRCSTGEFRALRARSPFHRYVIPLLDEAS